MAEHLARNRLPVDIADQLIEDVDRRVAEAVGVDLRGYVRPAEPVFDDSLLRVVLLAVPGATEMLVEGVRRQFAQLGAGVERADPGDERFAQVFDQLADVRDGVQVGVFAKLARHARDVAETIVVADVPLLSARHGGRLEHLRQSLLQLVGVRGIYPLAVQLAFVVRG